MYAHSKGAAAISMYVMIAGVVALIFLRLKKHLKSYLKIIRTECGFLV
jgi:hypothetical protein